MRVGNKFLYLGNEEIPVLSLFDTTNPGKSVFLVSKPKRCFKRDQTKATKASLNAAFAVSSS